MKIFSSLRLLDAEWVPTGKEGTEMVPGKVVESMFGKSLECEKDGSKCYIPLYHTLGDDIAPIGTCSKGFKWIEIGQIGRRSDNKFHDEDVRDSTERTYKVSELIL